MNKRYIAILFILQMAITGHTQSVQQAETFTLNVPISWDATYKAKTSIDMNPGFAADAKSNNITFDAEIDPNLSGVPADGGAGDLGNGLTTGFTDDNNVGAPPGTLPSKVEISATGAATCTIPLSFPKGFGGISPKLSLSYNSQFNRRGDFGKGWSLAGLSRISRTSEDRERDGTIEAVNFTKSDRFELDGQRLMLNDQSHSYGDDGAIYSKESGDYSVITSHGTKGNGPEYFTMVTKDGTSIQYGRGDANNYAPGTNTVMTWMVEKIEDARGNYILFGYNNTSDGQVELTNIKYTYNDAGSIGPQYTITFHYSPFTEAENNYLGGVETKIDQYIDYITCSDGTETTEYTFGYTNERLTSVSKTRNGLLVCRPTQIAWDAVTNQEKVLSGLSSFSGFSNMLMNTQDVATYCADFNGDGKDEVLKISLIDETYEVYAYENNQLVLKKSASLPISSKFKATLPLTYDCSEQNANGDTQIRSHCNPTSTVTSDFQIPVTVCDVDGDGKPEIILTWPYGSTDPTDPTGFYWSAYTLSNYTIVDKAEPGGGAYVSPVPMTGKFLLGDFNGDGITDPIIISGFQGSTNFNLDYGQSIIHLNVVQLANSDVMTANFDGDRKTDLYAISDNAVIVYECEPTTVAGQYTFVRKFLQNGIPSEKIQVGDFNGDGLTDLLAYNQSTNDWTLYYSNGKDGFVAQAASYTAALNSGSIAMKSPFALDFLSLENKTDYKNSGGQSRYAPSTNNCIYLTADFNKDGKTDVIKITREVSNTEVPNYLDDFRVKYGVDIFYSTGTGFNKVHYDGSEYYHPPGNITDPMQLVDDPNRNDVFGNVQFIQDIGFNQSTFQITDLNGDGYPELMHSHKDPSNILHIEGDDVIAIQPNSDDNDDKVISVTNGMNVEQDIQYTNLRGYSGYTQGSDLSGEGSAYTMDIPLNVAYQITTHEANIGTVSQKEYTYNSLRFQHIKGFLGFRSITATDNITKLKTVTTYGLNTTVYVPYPSDTKTYKNDVLLSDETKEIQLNPAGWAGYYIILPGTKTVTNELTNVIITTSYDNDVNTGNINSKTVTYARGTTTDGTIETSYPDGYTTLGRPYRIKTTRTQNGGSFTTNEYYTYDSYGNVLTHTDNNGVETSWTYADNHTNLATSTDKLGAVTTYTYDATKRFITGKQTQYSGGDINTETMSYDPEGRPLRSTDANGLVTAYQYDAYGNLAVKVNPNGRREAYSYGWGKTNEPTANIGYTEAMDDAGNVTVKYADAIGREIQTNSTPAGGQMVTIVNTYNADGTLNNKTSSIDGEESYTYYDNGRTKSVTSKGRTVNYTYPGTNTTIITTINGIKSIKSENAFGDIVSANDGGGAISYTYDPSGQVSTVTSNGQTVTNGYDSRGYQNQLTDPDAGSISYTYDDLGRLENETDANGNYTEMHYDDHGRVQSKNITNSAGVTRTVSYQYDPDDTHKGLLVSKMDSESGIRTSYTYDELGRVSTITENIDGKDYTTGYEYDGDGRVTRIIYPDGYSVTQTYDGGYIKTIKDDQTGTSLFSNISYNARGQITSYDLGNGNTLTNAYDQYGYIDNTVFGPTNNQIKYDYYVNPATLLLESRSKKYISSGSTQSETFTYDGLNRLTNWRVTQNGVNTDYGMSYQSNGNIVQKSDMGFYAYTGSKPNAVSYVSQLSGTSVDTRACHITYNSFNKTSEITKSNNGTLTDTYTITYGPDDTRRITDLNGAKTIYAGLYEVRPDGNHLHYIKTPDGRLGAVLVTNKNTGTRNMYYLYTDHLGSVVAVANEAGNIFKEFSYDPWGRRRSASDWNNYSVNSEPLFTRGFTGQEMLETFGLINMNGRMYDPRLARFLSPDNYVQIPDYTQNFNRYSYCLNNPLSYEDPNGEFFLGTILTFVGGFFKTALVNGGLDPTSQGSRQRAWRDFDPTAPWSPTNKAWKIDIGGFKTDPNRNFWGRAWQLISRWTWELPQTMAGEALSHFRNWEGWVDNVSYWGGATLVNRVDNSGERGGLTLGSYINSKNLIADPAKDPIFRHEYGHTLQSRLLGLMYITSVAIPSFVGEGLDRYAHINDHKREWYEVQADRMSYKYFSKHDPEALTKLHWDDNIYPRKYQPDAYWVFAHPPLLFMWWLYF